jgi:hypothetical protein
MSGVAMAVFVFRDQGTGSRIVHRSVCNCLTDPLPEDAVWSSSTYYGTKSPNCKLTAKEFLSIICPHIFVGEPPIIVKLKSENNASSELTKIDGFVGVLCGKLEKTQLLKLVQIIRRKRQEIGNAGRVSKLSIYDCIPDSGKSVEQCQSEITFCDNFIKQHVVYRMNQSPMWLYHSMRVDLEKSSVIELV